MRKCPLCGCDSVPVIMAWLPHSMCLDEECGCIFGWPTRLTARLPWSGALLPYTRGPVGYFSGLWWLIRSAFSRKGFVD